MTDPIDRRRFLKATGAAGATAVYAGQAAGGSPSTGVVDRQFDRSGGLQDALVVFDANESVERLGELDLADGFHRYRVLPIGYTRLDPDQLSTVAGWDEVRRVKRAEELELYNTDESREAMAVNAAQNLGYTGAGVDVVVIDTGVNASHPGVDGRVESNWQYVDDPLGPRDEIWVDVGRGDSDELGHGMHCAGIVGGDGGGGTQGDYRGMAPDVRISAYSTTQAVYLPYVVGAWDHMLARADDPGVDFDPKVVSNSYGVARGMRYNPNDPVNVASWEAFQRGILPVWAQGNDGPETGTSNRFAKAPHVLGVAAAKVEPGTDEHREIVYFSSRGRDLALDVENDEPVEYDREATLANLKEFHALQDGKSQSLVDTGTFRGTLGPGANSSPVEEGVDEETNTTRHTLETTPNADLVDLTLTVDPPSQWIRVTVRDESGTEVAMMGEEPVHQHRTLTFDVDGGTEYTIELEPEVTAVAEYELDYEIIDKFEIDGGYSDVSLSDVGPVTLFRPGISTHGVSVLSTEDPHDALAPLEPFFGGTPTEPFYHRLSGTSMACPAGAGVAALVVEAYRKNHPDGADPNPADVIRIIENTTFQGRKDYTPVNTGAGFVDAKVAVELAEDVAAGADVPPSDLGVLVDPDTPLTFSAGGSREDDGSAFTAGQTDHVRVTVSSLGGDVGSTDEVEIYDVVPDSWKVYATMDAEQGSTDEDPDDGVKEVPLGTVTKSEVQDSDGGVTFEYLVQVPDQSGAYTLGPAVAEVTLTTDDGERTLTAEFGGTDTNYVVGASTAFF